MVLGQYALNQKGWSTSQVIELVIQATDYKYFLEEQAAHHSSRGAFTLSQGAGACTVEYDIRARRCVSQCSTMWVWLRRHLSPVLTSLGGAAGSCARTTHARAHRLMSCPCRSWITVRSRSVS